MRFYLFLIFAAFLLLRLNALDDIPLTDPSEGRYADISENMLSSQNWLTPMLSEQNGVRPFLGKPPLHAWITASSLKFFGHSEFALRLPSLLASVLILLLVAHLGKILWGKEQSLVATIILSTSAIFYTFAGICLTDPILSLFICGAFYCFAATFKINRWYFIPLCLCLALGFLTKGPIALAIPFLAMGSWLVFTKQYSKIPKLPLLWGISCFLLISVPWFWAAEKANPGFLYYFFVNENFLRFVSKHYGDRYGSGHRHPLGTIWVFLFLAFLPWSLAIKLRFRAFCDALKADPWFAYTVFWGLSPAVFFTLAKQISLSYILPGLPGLALALSPSIVARLKPSTSGFNERLLKTFLLSSVLLCLIMAALNFKLGYLDFQASLAYVLTLGLLAFLSKANKASSSLTGSVSRLGVSLILLFSLSLNLSNYWLRDESSKELISKLNADYPGVDKINFLHKTPQSAHFYTTENGTSKIKLNTVSANANSLPEADLIISRESDLKRISEEIRSQLSLNEKVGPWLLFRSK